MLNGLQMDTAGLDKWVSGGPRDADARAGDAGVMLTQAPPWI